MSNQGIKKYGTYYSASIKNGSSAYVNLSKQYDNVHFVIPLYSSKYKLSPINLSLIYTSSNNTVDYNLKKGFKLSIVKELSYVNSSTYKITNPDLSTEDYSYSSASGKYENTELVSYMIIENNLYKVVYKDTIYTFDSSYKLIKIEDRHNSINKINIDYEQGHIESIYNDYGESLMLIKNTNYLRIEISKDGYSVYDIVLNYDSDDYISEISYYVYKNNTDNLYGQLQLAFDNYKEIYDAFSKERIRIKHPSTNAYKVLEGSINDEELLRESTINFIDNYHTSVKYNNLYTHYYFDDRYLINHCVDFTKSIIGYSFDGKKNLLFMSNLFKNNYQHQEEICNLVTDGFCQQGISAWITDNATLYRSTNSTSHINVTSPLCLGISNANVSSSNTYQLINVEGTPLDVLTFRCLSECFSTSGGGHIKIYLLKNNVIKQSIPTYTLSTNHTCAYFNVISIEPVVCFDQVKIVFELFGTSTYYSIESICLTKQKAGKAYLYDSKNEVTEVKKGKTITNIFTDRNHRLIGITGKYKVISYAYDNNQSLRNDNLVNDDLTRNKKGIYGNRTEYTYNNLNELNEEKVVSHEYDSSILKDRDLSLTKENTFDQSGEFIVKEKTNDIEIDFVSDGSKHYLLENTIFPDGTKYDHEYNNKNLLSKVTIKDSSNNSLEENETNYDSHLNKESLLDKRINKIKYYYNGDNKLSSVKIENSNSDKSLVNVKYINENSTIDPHLNMIESKEYGNNGDKYIFEYDNKYNLSTIKYREKGTSTANNKYNFEYDAYNRLKIVNNADSTNFIYHSYDSDNRLCEISNNNQVSNILRDNYDSVIRLYNLIFTDGNEIYQSFTESKESNVFAPEHFYEMIKLLKINDINATFSCFFNDDNSDLTYKNEDGSEAEDNIEANVNHTIISERLHPLIKLMNSQTRLCYDVTGKGIQGFSVFAKVKSGGVIASLVGVNNNNLYITYDKINNYLKCYYGSSLLLNVNMVLSSDKEYALSLLLENNNLNLIVNDKKYTYNNIGSIAFNKLCVGCKYNSLTSGANLYLYGIVAFKGVTINDVYKLSYKGLNYIFGSVEYNGNYTYCGFDSTTLFKKELLDGYKVAPLFNNYNCLPSINNLQLYLIDYENDINELSDSSFIYNKKTHRCNLYLDKNKVIYQTGLDTAGTILIRFTVNEYSIENSSYKTLFRLFKENNSGFKLSIKESKLYLNENLIDNSLVVSDGVNNLAFAYYYNNNNLNYKVVLNNDYYDNGIIGGSSDYSWWKLQLGNENDLSKPLGGFVEMLCIDDGFSDISSMQSDLLKLNYSLLINKYDPLGRVTLKNTVHNDNTIISHTYNYVKSLENNNYLASSKIESEVISRNSTNYTLQYVYDSMNRIKQIKMNNTLIKDYSYNELGYLVSDDNLEAYGAQHRLYMYDESGNITRRDIKVNGTIVNSRLYKYDDSLNKNALTRITDANGNTLESISYDTYMGSLPVSITSNGTTKALTWEGLKLTSYGNVTYNYDYLGRRESKITSTRSFKYVYDIRGNLVGEKVTTLSNNSFYYVDYLYDKDNNLYGFKYDGNIYYYIKDILGIIKYIVDSNGSILLEYTYDAFGNIIYTNQSPYTNLYDINHIVYKSYYMDFENSLYYLKTRYYNPNWGRFVSIDKIEYLNENVACGLNLYAYCLNDPINNSDPDGTWSWEKFFIGVAITAAVTAAVALTIVTYGAGAAIAGAGIASYTLATGAAVCVSAIATTGIAATCSVAAMPTKDEHYNRNQYNIDLPENITAANEAGWDSGVAANAHQFSAVDGENVKFVDPDGKREVIFDSSGNMVTDPRDIGTYNFCPSGGFVGSAGHFVKDILPWIVWGNTPDDTTTVVERIMGLIFK